MPDQPEATPRLDLSTYSEATRRALYDRVAEENFSSKEGDLREASDEAWVDPRSAAEAGLAVHYFFGRWIVVWAAADAAEDAPEAERWEVLRVTLGEDGSLWLSEC